ncbi:unnamed protein product [Onchocerca flexuosa]|uniref:G_PROTEIN_RECEP_F1_2 domain-containing protein n=1 Tax=Onchocerca flexuosa TaxID=387005 RepID=A0A183I051_9BILA|nr:unnamed protein product [Onchocerca flexuosa]
MIAEFVHSQYRVIIAVTAILVGIFPQTYLFALSSRQYTRSQGQLCCADDMDISCLCKRVCMDTANGISILCSEVSLLFIAIPKTKGSVRSRFEEEINRKYDSIKYLKSRTTVSS